MSKIILDLEGKYHNAHDNLPDDVSKLVINDCYYIESENCYRIYRGLLDESNEEPRETGIYYNTESDSIFVLADDNEELLTKDNIIDDDFDDDIIESMNSLDTVIKEEETVKEEVVSDKPKRTRKANKSKPNKERFSRDKIIYLDPSLEDTDLNRIIKNKLNEKKMCLSDIYKKVPFSESRAYNLFYGLQERHSMHWGVFLTWCEILDIKPTLTIEDI